MLAVLHKHQLKHAQYISMKNAGKTKTSFKFVMHIHYLQTVENRASIFRKHDGAKGKRPTKQSFKSTAIYWSTAAIQSIEPYRERRRARPQNKPPPFKAAALRAISDYVHMVFTPCATLVMTAMGTDPITISFLWNWISLGLLVDTPSEEMTRGGKTFNQCSFLIFIIFNK